MRGSGVGDFERIEYVECDALIDEGTDAERVCTFSDQEDVLYADNGYRIWTCPQCEHRHFEDYDI